MNCRCRFRNGCTSHARWREWCNLLAIYQPPCLQCTQHNTSRCPTGLIQIIRRHILGNSIAPDILCKHFFQYDHCLDAKWWGWGGLSQLLMRHHPWMAHRSISTTWVQYGGGGDYDGGGEVANSSNYLPGTRYCIKRIQYSLPLFPCSAGSTKTQTVAKNEDPVAKVLQSCGGSFLPEYAVSVCRTKRTNVRTYEYTAIRYW